MAIPAGLVAILIIAFLLVVKSTPGFYRPPQLNAPDFEAAAKRLEDKLIELRNLAAETQAAQASGQVNNTRYVVVITQDELNAFMLKWAELNTLRDQYERYIRQPMVAFEPGRVIFAAEANVGPVSCVASLHANIEQSGNQLKMTLDHVQAGRLTLPESAWRGSVDRFESEIDRQLHSWKAAAKFDRIGIANESAAKAIYGNLLLATLKGRPADVRTVIPVSSTRGVAVRIVGLKVETGKISLTLVPLSAGERARFLEELKASN